MYPSALILEADSNAEQGGTWAGATEALKAQWLSVFVLDHSNMPQGNRALLEKGANPLPVQPAQLKAWLDEHILPSKPHATQPRLF